MIDINNLAGLSEPATALINRCSNGLGGVFLPGQIVRVAKAESKAAIIKASGEIEIERLKVEGAIEVASLRERAIARLIHEESKSQENIENIVIKALPEVKQDANPDDIEEDWISNFFDKCKLVSNEEMQFLWGKVLAGEANIPGSFSKRTVNLLQELDQNEARKFRSLCNFAVNTYEKELFIYNENDKIYDTHDITFSMFLELQALNLITYNHAGISLKVNHKFECTYFKKTYTIYPSEYMPNQLKVGRVSFTRTGEEIAQICETSPIDGFGDYLVNKWKGFGCKVEIVDSKIPPNPNVPPQ